MKVTEGWVKTEEGNLTYYDENSEDHVDVKAVLYIEGNIYVWNDSTDIGYNKHYLNIYFQDFLKTTVAETTLFELEFGFPYPPQELLDGLCSTRA